MKRQCIAVASLLFLGSAPAAADVDYYVEFATKDPGAVASAIDGWFESDDNTVGHAVNLFAISANGENPATHLIVGQFADFATAGAFEASRADSAAWRKYEAAFGKAATTVADGMAVTRATYGTGWNQHPWFAVVAVAVTDPARYVAAFERLSNSSVGKSAPGATHVLANRFGVTGVSHFVVLTSPDFAQLNEYMERLFSSPEYATFNNEVSEIRTLAGSSIMRRVKRWEK